MDSAQLRKLASGATARLSDANGDQLSVKLQDAKDNKDGMVDATVLTDGIQGAGEYTGQLSLDPLAEQAAALDVTVKARHHWLWALLVLFAGVTVGVGGTALYEARRRQTVLRLVLLDLGAWLQSTPTVDGLHDLPDELVGRAGTAPGSAKCSDSTLKALPRLYCEMGTAWTSGDLDKKSQSVQEMRCRAELWYRAAAEAARLRATHALLAGQALEKLEEEFEALLGQIKGALELESRETIDRVEAQAAVAEVFALAYDLWVGAGSDAALDPLKIYDGFEPADTRKLADFPRLVGRLRVQQLKIQTHATAPAYAITGAFGDGGQVPHILLSAPPGPALLIPPPWLPGGAEGAGTRVRHRLRVFDVVVYLSHLFMAAIAFLLPVYIATNFGTVDQYLAIFVAGFLGKVVLEQSLALVRSAQLTPTPQPAPARGAQ